MRKRNKTLNVGDKVKFEEELFFQRQKHNLGTVVELAPFAKAREFAVKSISDDIYTLQHGSGSLFTAKLKYVSGRSGGKTKVAGCLHEVNKGSKPLFGGLSIEGKGSTGEGLRPAQVGAIYSLLSHWSLTDEVATIVLPTGTGKTETMLTASLADQAKRTLVIVPTIDLKMQTSEKFSSWGILRELGVLTQETRNPVVLTLEKSVTKKEDLDLILSCDVVVTTPGLLTRVEIQLNAQLQKAFSHVYFDEAHHIVAKEWEALKALFSTSRIVQFTATPYRTDKKPIQGKIIYNYPLSKALKDGSFSRISLIAVSERHPKKKDKAIAQAAMRRLLSDRKKGYVRHKMMVRAVNKEQADTLFKLYKQWFPKERIALVLSVIKGRKKLVADIKNGKYDIVVCVDMLKEGFDYPDLKIAAVHGIHKSLGVLLQFIGRFTRTMSGLGDASFVVNYAEENIALELEDMLQDGTGWEQVISEVADAKKVEAESFLSFLQGCKPISGFDNPDISINPKLVYPALSFVCFEAKQVIWNNYKNAFDTSKYALTHPYCNAEERLFYFCTQTREKVKWARSDRIRDQKWDLIIMHHDVVEGMLYVGFSEKRLDLERLVHALTGEMARPYNGDKVFRSFDAIKRLSIVHAGIFKPANHLHRYSRLSGADVTTELTKWKQGKRCKKSDFVGIGFRNGFPVGIGASVKGKIWSPARIGDIQTWKQWCLEIGKMIRNNAINVDHLLEDSAERTQLEKYPDNLVVLATDWSESFYDRIHKLTIERPNKPSFLLAESALRFISSKGVAANFTLNLFDEQIEFSIKLGGEQGHNIIGLDDSDIHIEGLKSKPVPIKQVLEQNPPTLFLLNGCTLAGCIYTDYGESFAQQIPNERVISLSWENVNFKVETYYKSGNVRKNSIQQYVMDQLVSRGASVVFNDDHAGESADVIGVFVQESVIRFEMIHCKYSKAKAGARLSDLYEVCGQAIVSLRYKWRPEELLKHMERRNGAGALKGKRFYRGNESTVEEIRKALRYTDVQFEFAIAQPGVNTNAMSLDMKNFLGSVYATIVEMTETKLRCYFS